MPAPTLIPLPRVTRDRSGQWPLLAPTQADRLWTAAPMSGKTTTRLPGRPRPSLHVRQKLPGALIKGLVLAGIVVAIVFGLLPSRVWWLQGWHLVGGIMVAGGVIALAGLDTGLILMMVVAVLLALPQVATHAVQMVTIVVIVAAGRLALEWLLAAQEIRRTRTT